MVDVFDTDRALTFFTAGFTAAGCAVFTVGSLRAAVGFAVAFAPTGRLAAADLTAGFALRPPLTAAFLLAAVVGALSFFTLAAVELRVVFAIFLHRFWPWRPGVIAHVPYTSKHDSGILVALDTPVRAGYVNVLTRLILSLLRFYKRWLSPLLGPRCRFHPSCSDYARIAVMRFGPWRGSLLAGWRLLRCQPLCTGGEDPVPEHFHFSRCHGRGEDPNTH